MPKTEEEWERGEEPALAITRIKEFLEGNHPNAYSVTEIYIETTNTSKEPDELEQAAEHEPRIANSMNRYQVYLTSLCERGYIEHRYFEEKVGDILDPELYYRAVID